MARVKGGYLGGTYDVPSKQPLDSRMLVTKRADLINPSVWKTNGSTTGESGHYNGMIVAVNSDGVYNGVYYLTNRAAITADNYAAYRTALANGEDVESYFAMWTKLAEVGDEAEKSVFNAKTHYDFPSIGKDDVIYKAESERLLYQWNTTELKYEVVGETETDNDWSDIKIINGGDADLV